jgi:hypothetical protein
MFYFILTGIASLVSIVYIYKLMQLALHAENPEIKRLARIITIIVIALAIRGDYTLKLIHKLQAFVNQPEDQRYY